MKKLFGLILIFVIPFEIFGGQMPQLSQYMLNGFYLNPALAGTYKRYIIKASYRYQWLGWGPESPQIMSVSVFGPHEDIDIGYGGYFYSDNTGPTSRNGLMGSFAYNFVLFDAYRLSLGLSAGFMQYYLDAGDLTFGQDGDPILLSQPYSEYVPDANVGLYLYEYSLYVGFSSHQLFGNKLPLYENIVDTLESVNRLRRHYYFTAGYHFEIDGDWSVDPSMILIGSYPQPLQLEVSARANFMNTVWGGLSYRTGDYMSTFSVLASYKHERKFEFGISYDLNVSKFSRGYGSVEVMLGYWFDEIRKRR